MASIELDPSIKQALKHLHSGARDSTDQVRMLLDDLIRYTCSGPARTMANVLPKKYLSELPKAKHKAETTPNPKAKGVPPPTPSPQQIQIPERDDDDDDGAMDNELTFKLLIEEDLICAVCKQISVQVGNQLVECVSCHALYHQDCHKPSIRNSDVGAPWHCAACLAARQTPPPPSKPPAPKCSVKIQPAPVPPPPGSSSASKLVTPNINIISADKRLQIMKKKAAKQQENKRKHSK